MFDADAKRFSALKEFPRYQISNLKCSTPGAKTLFSIKGISWLVKFSTAKSAANKTNNAHYAALKR